jgi:hypothetical protein
MKRYFFHLRDGDTLLPDDGEGQELPSLKAVRLHAIETVRELLSEAALRGKASSLCQQIEVRDEGGKTVLTLSVGRATDTEAQT